MDSDMIIAADTLISGDGHTIIRNGGILCENEKIIAVGEGIKLREAYPQEEYVDYGPATILPGLIDMHVHIAYYLNRSDTSLYTDHLVAYQALYNAQLMLFNGVTTIRDVFCPSGVCRQLAYAAKKGFVRAPRIIHSNRALTNTGGIDWQSGGATVQVDGPEEIRKAVRREIREGAQWIKAMTSWRKPNVAQFDQEELNMIVNETHRLGYKTAAHATLQPALQMCIEAGFDTIEHGTDLTLEQAQIMKEKGIAYTPTIYVHKAIYEQLAEKLAMGGVLSEYEKQTYSIYKKATATYAQNFLPIYNSGVLTLAGTDCVFEGMENISVAHELACMVEYGLKPVQAIATAAKNAAQALDLSGHIGELCQGAIADVLVVSGDAGKDITALKQICDVYQNGVRIQRAI